MRKLLEAVMLAAITLLVGGAAVMWTLRDDRSVDDPATVPASLASALPVEPPVSGRAPIRVTSVEDLGRLSEAGLRKLENEEEHAAAIELDTDSFRAGLQRRLSAVSLEGLDFSVTIPPVTNPSGTASTGATRRTTKPATKPAPKPAPAAGTDSPGS